MFITDKRIVLHRRQGIPAGNQHFQKLGDILQHLFCTGIPAVRLSLQGFRQNLLHPLHHMSGASGLSQGKPWYILPGLIQIQFLDGKPAPGEQKQHQISHTVNIRLRPQPEGSIVFIQHLWCRKAGRRIEHSVFYCPAQAVLHPLSGGTEVNE